MRGDLTSRTSLPSRPSTQLQTDPQIKPPPAAVMRGIQRGNNPTDDQESNRATITLTLQMATLRGTDR